MNEKHTDQAELWPSNPHSIPRIQCSKCGKEHHITAANGEFQGQCQECYGFLRRPARAEQEQFTDFLEWNARQSETDSSRD